MIPDLYERLARHLDELPAGFPRTKDGVEIRILRRLFTPEDAELALHLTMLPEPARVVALRAGLTTAEAERRLEDMAQRGLIFGSYHAGRPPRYMAYQFAVGVWEAQVKRLSPELVEDVEQYLTTYGPSVWKSAPQLRTIPVGKAVEVPTEVMPYERAEELLRGQETVAVTECICRQALRLLGQSCDKPLETCVSLGLYAAYLVHIGRARPIDLSEALGILELADEAGLVLQPGNSQAALGFCACCGCCCAALRTLKLHDRPAQVAVTPFVAQVDTAVCLGCGTCAARCQMEAIAVDEDVATLDPERCIGCGLCVSTCPSGAVRLVRKPQAEQRPVPPDTVASLVAWSLARGKMDAVKMVGLGVRSTVDRLRAPK
jgi:ferredoxin